MVRVNKDEMDAPEKNKKTIAKENIINVAKKGGNQFFNLIKNKEDLFYNLDTYDEDSLKTLHGDGRPNGRTRL